MTSPSVELSPVPPPVQTTTRSQCTRAGVIAKYYRRNSGDVESSPLYSAWFREEIIADQRFERRRKLLSLNRARYCYSEMEIDYSDSYWASRRTSRPFLRGKRQADCKICHTELTDWTLVTSPSSHVTPPSTCYHLFHTSCYQYWRCKSKPSDDARCPVCVRSIASNNEPTAPVTERQAEPVVLSPVVLQQVPLVLRGSLLSVTGETPLEVLTETGDNSSEVAGVTQVNEEKEDKDVVSVPVLES